MLPVPYEGERGIGALLRRVAAEDGWKPLIEGEHVIALEKDGASITLEPGGQLELSGAPLRTIHETCDEFHAHLVADEARLRAAAASCCSASASTRSTASSASRSCRRRATASCAATCRRAARWRSR